MFKAEIGSAAVVVSTLKGILFKAQGTQGDGASAEGFTTVVTADSRGLKFTYTDASKSLQGCASIQEVLFDVWHIQHHVERASFRIRLSLLLQCLSGFGMSSLEKTTLKMAYFPDEECFCMQLMEGDVLTECKITTLEDDNDSLDAGSIDFVGAFDAADFQNRVIIASDRLRDAFGEISDLPGASTCNMLISPEAPFFRISTMGEHGSCQIDFPHGSESFTQFRCEAKLEYSFRMSHMQQATRALSFAHRTFIRLNSAGLLSMQHMVKVNESKTYVDYYVISDAAMEEMEIEDEND